MIVNSAIQVRQFNILSSPTVSFQQKTHAPPTLLIRPSSGATYSRDARQSGPGCVSVGHDSRPFASHQPASPHSLGLPGFVPPQHGTTSGQEQSESTKGSALPLYGVKKTELFNQMYGVKKTELFNQLIGISNYMKR